MKALVFEPDEKIRLSMLKTLNMLLDGDCQALEDVNLLKQTIRTFKPKYILTSVNTLRKEDNSVYKALKESADECNKIIFFYTEFDNLTPDEVEMFSNLAPGKIKVQSLVDLLSTRSVLPLSA